MLVRLLVRAGILVASLLAATGLVFALLAVLPGDPARVALGVNADPAAVAQLRREFGLDRPLPVQYADWVVGLLRGDFGRSPLSGVAIGPQVLDRLQVTLWLVGAGTALSLLLAVPAGMFAALRHRGTTGVVLSVLSQVGIAVPSFLAGIALITVFAVRLRWLPAGGWTPPDVDAGQFVAHLVLPVLSLGLVQAAVLTRYVRSAVLDVLHEDYLRTARAKGLTPFRALLRHGLRNAAVPVVTVLGLQLATLLVGAVVVERVFVLPGLGSLLLDAVGNRDLLVVRDVVMVLVFAVLCVNAVVDLLYAVLDPRLRTGR